MRIPIMTIFKNSLPPLRPWPPSPPTSSLITALCLWSSIKSFDWLSKLSSQLPPLSILMPHHLRQQLLFSIKCEWGCSLSAAYLLFWLVKNHLLQNCNMLLVFFVLKLNKNSLVNREVCTWLKLRSRVIMRYCASEYPELWNQFDINEFEFSWTNSH